MMIREVEERSLNAWAALQTVLVDGWVLRFSNGYTKRANSVNPLYAGTWELEKRIRACEELYGRRGLAVVFKLTPQVEPPGLDAALEGRGYRVDSPTSVQCVSLADAEVEPARQVEMSAAVSDEWMEAYCRMNGVGDENRMTLARMLHGIVPEKRFALLSVDGYPLSCGLGVVENGYLGLFDIVTVGAARRQGYGEQLVRSLMTWGSAQGAHTGYLQVMVGNEAALALYEKLGFREVYQYWYRVKL